MKSTDPTPLQRAVLRTVVYYDLLGYALHLTELQHYLEGMTASLDELMEVLGASDSMHQQLVVRQDYVVRAGREQLIADRELYARQQHPLWKRARRVSGLLWRVPFVRMIAVSGTLALEHTREQSDIDLFIITRRNRIWLTRVLTTLIVKLLGLYRQPANTDGKICLNHYVTDDEGLELDSHSLYVARLFSNMTPIYGWESYRDFQKANTWITGLLPAYPWHNYPPYEVGRSGWLVSKCKAVGEWLIGGRIGDGLERWAKHQQLKHIEKDERKDQASAQVVLTDQALRFHLEAQEPVMMRQFEEATGALGL